MLKFQISKALYFDAYLGLPIVILFIFQQKFEFFMPFIFFNTVNLN